MNHFCLRHAAPRRSRLWPHDSLFSNLLWATSQRSFFEGFPLQKHYFEYSQVRPMTPRRSDKIYQNFRKSTRVWSQKPNYFQPSPGNCPRHQNHARPVSQNGPKIHPRRRQDRPQSLPDGPKKKNLEKPFCGFPILKLMRDLQVKDTPNPRQPDWPI